MDRVHTVGIIQLYHLFHNFIYPRNPIINPATNPPPAGIL